MFYFKSWILKHKSTHSFFFLKSIKSEKINKNRKTLILIEKAKVEM